jgi:hypothetical protein
MIKLFEVTKNVEVTSAAGGDISHIYMVDPMVILASRYAAQGKYIEAEAQFKQYIDKMKVELGDSHPDTIATKNTTMNKIELESVEDIVEDFILYAHEQTVNSKAVTITTPLVLLEKIDAYLGNSRAYSRSRLFSFLAERFFACNPKRPAELLIKQMRESQ